MKWSKIHGPFLTTMLILGLRGWATPVEANPPRFDSAWKHFDTERSPLQKGLLDARDKKWRKNIKLGSDPRCARVVRKYARHPDRSPKLCSDLNADLPWSDINKEKCIRFYCCEEPDIDGPDDVLGPPDPEIRSDDLTTCNGDDDEGIVACANALIGGGADIQDKCVQTSQSAIGGSGPPEQTCAELIFSLDLPGQQGQRYLDCLEDPFRECPSGDPECDPEIKGNCKHIFKELEQEGGGACVDLPFVVPDVPSNRGRFSVIKNSNGRTVGKRIQTRTVIHYDVTTQRRSADDAGTVVGNGNSWDPVRISKFQKNQGRAPGKGQRADSVLSSGAFNLECDPAVYCPANEDRDCYDKVTGEHYRGDQCFDGVNLRETLKDLTGPCPIESEAVCCEQNGVPDQGVVGTGEVLYGDDCELGTTLVQMIDEDPPEVLNNDGDCYLENTQYQGLTSDCVLPDGNLRAGYVWNENEEGSCSGTNNDNDCMGLVDGETRARIGMIDSGRCVDGFTGETIGEVLDEDYVALIDEDCEDRIDNDGDGRFDEDGAGIASQQATAVALGGKAALLQAEQDACAAVNHRMRQNSAKYQTFIAETGSQKFFHADKHGRWCGKEGANEDDCTEVGGVHPDNPHKPRASGGNRKYKYEKQRVTVDEVFGIKCKRVKVPDDQAPSGWAWVPTHYDEDPGL